MGGRVGSRGQCVCVCGGSGGVGGGEGLPEAHWESVPLGASQRHTARIHHPVACPPEAHAGPTTTTTTTPKAGNRALLWNVK